MSVSRYVQILNEILPNSITIDGLSALFTDVKLIQAYFQIIYAQKFDLPNFATDLAVNALFQQIPDVNDRQFAISCDISNFESVLDLVDMICSVYLDQQQMRAQQQKEVENESVLNNLQKQMNENQNLINIQQEHIRTLKQTESNQNNVISEYQVLKRNYNTYLKQIQNGYKQIRENEDIWSGKEFTEEIEGKMMKIDIKIQKIDEQVLKYLKIKEKEESKQVSNMKEENKELTEQIILLQKQLNTENIHFLEYNLQIIKQINDEKVIYHQRIKELESQNQNLQLEFQQYQLNNCSSDSTVQQLQAEIDKLKQISEEVSAQIQQTMLEYSIHGDSSLNQPLSGVAALKDYIEQVRNQLMQQQQISASQGKAINEKDSVLQSLDAKDLQLQEQNSNLTSQLAQQDVVVETIRNQLKQQTQQQNLLLKSVIENVQNLQSEEIKKTQGLALQILQQTDGRILTIDKQLKYLTERNQKQIETTKQLASILQTEQSEGEILVATKLLVQKQQDICKSETQLQQELNFVHQQNTSLDQWKKHVISSLAQFFQVEEDNSGDSVSQKLKQIITDHKIEVDLLTEECAKMQLQSDNLQVQLKAKQDTLDQDTAVQHKISEENQSLKQQLAQLKSSSDSTVQQLQAEIDKLKQISEEVSAQIQQTMLEYSIHGDSSLNQPLSGVAALKDYIEQVRNQLMQQQQIPASQGKAINEKDSVLQSLDAKDLQLQEQNSNLTSQLAQQDVVVETIRNQLKQQTQQQNLLLKSVIENVQNLQSEEIKKTQGLALQILQQTDGRILTIDKQLKYLTERNQKQIETTKQLASILQTEQSEGEILVATKLLVQKQQDICKSETQLQQELNFVHQQNTSLDQWKKHVISSLAQFFQVEEDNSGDSVSQKLKQIITDHKIEVDLLTEECAKMQLQSDNLQVQLKAKQDTLDQDTAVQHKISEENQSLKQQLAQLKSSSDSTVQQLQAEIDKLKQISEEVSAQIQQTMLEYSIHGDSSSNQPLSGVAALKDYIEQVRNQLMQQQQISASQGKAINEKDSVLQSLDAKDLQLQEQNSNLTSQLAQQDVVVETIRNQLKQQTQQQNLLLKSVIENVQNLQSEEIKEIQGLALQILQQTDGRILTIDKQLKYLTERNQKQIETTKQLASILQTEQSEGEILVATKLLVQKQQDICKSETQLQQELNFVHQQNTSLDQWKKHVISSLAQFFQVEEDNSGDSVSQKLKQIITDHKIEVDLLTEECAKMQLQSDNLQVQLKAKQDTLDQDTAVQHKISEENLSLKQQLAQLKSSSDSTVQQLQAEIDKLKQISEEVSAQIQQTMLEYSIHGDSSSNQPLSGVAALKDYIEQVRNQLMQQQQISASQGKAINEKDSVLQSLDAKDLQLQEQNSNLTSQLAQQDVVVEQIQNIIDQVSQDQFKELSIINEQSNLHLDDLQVSQNVASLFKHKKPTVKRTPNTQTQLYNYQQNYDFTTMKSKLLELQHALQSHISFIQSQKVVFSIIKQNQGKQLMYFKLNFQISEMRQQLQKINFNINLKTLVQLQSKIYRLKKRLISKVDKYNLVEQKLGIENRNIYKFQTILCIQKQILIKQQQIQRRVVLQEKIQTLDQNLNTQCQK
ncbi:Hypothetical_protein [Hexamita inflata]|uniref:Hypothetical_protein n=1 Tax=Hexamita inflata TaxID=28002 RepID=A0AA86TP58_9EUKA|nr:Hypothetical protein HINF_LOCUS12074 [Hexamita inflata]